MAFVIKTILRRKNDVEDTLFIWQLMMHSIKKYEISSLLFCNKLNITMLGYHQLSPAFTSPDN
jgi:hypothetical protein